MEFVQLHFQLLSSIG